MDDNSLYTGIFSVITDTLLFITSRTHNMGNFL